MGAGVDRPGRGRWVDRFGWVLVVAAGLLAYHNCFDGQYFLDDGGTFEHDEEVWKTSALVPNPLVNRWLGRWTFAAGIAAFGGKLPALHAVNLAIHLLAGVALWGVVSLTLRLPRFGDRFAGRSGLLATIIAGLWVVHPLTTAAVTYLTQRYESQMSMLVLVALWAAIRAAIAPTGSIRWYVLAVAAAYGAAATKEPAFLFPFVFLVYDRLFLAGSWRQVIRKRWGFLLASQVAVAPVAMPMVNQLRAQIAPETQVESQPELPPEPLILSGLEGLYRNESEFVSAGFSATGITPWQYLRTQPEIILHYLRLSIIPTPLVLDYNWPIATNWWQIWPPGLVIVALLGATVWAVARGLAGGFFGVWLFAFLALSSSFIPLVDLAFEHRMYLPLVAVVAVVVFVVDGCFGWLAARSKWSAEKLLIGFALAVGAGFITLTVMRNDEYCDPIQMERRMLQIVPDNGRAWHNLGVHLMRSGRLAEAGEAFRQGIQHPSERSTHPALSWLGLIVCVHRTQPTELVPTLSAFAAADPSNPSRRFLLAHARFERGDRAGAVAEYRTAIEMAAQRGIPLTEPMVFAYYGQSLVEAGEQDAAIPILLRALTLQKKLPTVHNLLGQVFTRQKKYEEAEQHLRAATEQAPQWPNAPYNLGVLRMHQGRPADAVNWFREAKKRDGKDLVSVLGLGSALHESGQVEEARKEYALAQRLYRDWPQQAVQISWRMSTHPEARARYAAESLRMARLVVDGLGENDPGVLDVLAAALAESGQFEEAERIAKRAVEIATSGKHLDLAKEIESRRSLYARQQPYRQPSR